MKASEINIRDPFVLIDDGKYYLYGTRAKDFGKGVGGFDVYVSDDMENWSEPAECFDSEKYGMNTSANWAPEVYKYNGKYYMFATFTREMGWRATYSLVSDTPTGPFTPKGIITPEEWECLDGTLYVEDGVPYVIFCREHTQIIDGTMCYARLADDLSGIVGDVTTLFSASSPKWADPFEEGKHYITDGPYMYRSKTGVLFMLWSTKIGGQYAECLVRFKGGKLGMDLEHLDPIITSDGGHGMIFEAEGKKYLTFHTPNSPRLAERPAFRPLIDEGDTIRVGE